MAGAELGPSRLLGGLLQRLSQGCPCSASTPKTLSTSFWSAAQGGPSLDTALYSFVERCAGNQQWIADMEQPNMRHCSATSATLSLK